MDNSTNTINPCSASLDIAYSKEIRPFIEIIDKLRKHGLQQDIDLPKVVVVGDQSSGKSSILEAISGVQLPRGKGIVTRCPLELQLKRTPGYPWRSILSYKTRNGLDKCIEIEEPRLIERHIRKAQEEICITKNEISAELITLRVENPSESAPELTLIDLPGIVRTNLDDQPADICDRIMNIIMDQIKNKNTVIICVIASHLDVSVNESIKLARKVDKDGSRTLGIITKPDMADESQKPDIVLLLNNKKIKLQKGFNMMKCRSQKELERQLSLKESLQNEELFFEEDPYYSTVNPSQLGTMNFASKITAELVSIIKLTLPKLRQSIEDSLKEVKNRLYRLPTEIPDKPMDKQLYLMKIIMTMNDDLKLCLEQGKTAVSEYHVFAEWRFYFDTFKTEMEDSRLYSMENEFSINTVNKIISNRRGKEISGFLDYELFESLVKDHIQLYKGQAETLLQKIIKSTEKIIIKIVKHHLAYISSLQTKITKIVCDEILLVQVKCKERLESIFDDETIIFTSDSIFEREIEILKQKNLEETRLAGGKKNIMLSIEESIPENNAERLQNIILCYLKIVHSRLSDYIPMAIRRVLHIELLEKLKDRLTIYAMSMDNLENVVEDKSRAKERAMLTSKIERLQLAIKEIIEFDM